MIYSEDVSVAIWFYLLEQKKIDIPGLSKLCKTVCHLEPLVIDPYDIVITQSKVLYYCI